MAEFFLMPQASPTMTVGVVAKWVAAEGAALAPQSVIAEVETDKATMEIEVFDTCVLRKHLAAVGEEIPPGKPIAILAKDATEDITALVAEWEAGKTSASAAPAEETPPLPVGEGGPEGRVRAATAPAEETPPLPVGEGGPEGRVRAATAPAEETPPLPVGEGGPDGRVRAATGSASAVSPAPPIPPEAPAPAFAAPSWHDRPMDPAIMEPRGVFASPAPRVLASPLARVIAGERGLSLARVKGSGPNGRIVAADVESAGTVAVVAPPADSPHRVTQMRKTIARRLTEVHQQVPVFFLTVTLDMTAMVAWKARLGDRGAKVSYNDLFLKAVAAALREVPACNAAWMGDSIVERGAVDLGVAVATETGLITPVIRNADTKSVTQIAAEIRELAGRAKLGKLQAEEYTGSSFTVSNLGMFDVDHFTAILNPPEAGILAVGRVAQVADVVNGRVEPAWRMKVTMTCDHRVIDGALGARFLQSVRGFVECPALMVP